MSRVLGIDPGNVLSAYMVMDSETLKPIEFAKLSNGALNDMLRDGTIKYDEAAIERVQSFGMPVGKSVFQTCEEIGRLSEIIESHGKNVSYIYRQDEKLHICHDSRAKDANIRRALIERFAAFDFETGKGTKKNPDWWYGMKADTWSAAAICLTYIEAGPSEVEV